MTTSTTYNFDQVIDRRDQHNCAKWTYFDSDVLPMWVADMDFASPPAVLEELHQRVDHGVFGYTMPCPVLRQTIVDRMQTLYDWTIEPDSIVFMPGLVLGLNMVTRSVGKAGDGVIMQTPVYGPFLKVPANNGRFAQMTDLIRVDDDDYTFHYENDFDAFESAITKQTSLFLLCNPHNPAGKVYSPDELRTLAEICLKNDIVICSDEIHCDLLLDGNKHTPIAALSKEIEQNTITLMAPSKTFNLPGLACSFAIIPNAELREKVEQTLYQTGAHVNLFGFEAARAAYQHGGDWLAQALDYMQANRDYLLEYLRENMPMIKATVPQATYLAWLDCSNLPVPDGQTPQNFFLEEGRIALNPGEFFSDEATDFVRINFGCPRVTLEEGLERMKAAIDKII